MQFLKEISEGFFNPPRDNRYHRQNRLGNRYFRFNR